MNNKDLQKIFKLMNKRFFAERIPDMTVKFGDIEDDGICTPDEIIINKDLKGHSDYAIITLLHEMVHADVNNDGYIGYENDGGHHTRFYAGIDRLYKAGAYEGLL
jgi:hypothetical protein